MLGKFEHLFYQFTTIAAKQANATKGLNEVFAEVAVTEICTKEN